jgi:hypothetical protein
VVVIIVMIILMMGVFFGGYIRHGVPHYLAASS